MAYVPTSFDVCNPGMERLRNQSEFLLVAYIHPSSTAKEIAANWNHDLQSCMREDDFDYDAARAAIDQAMRDWVRPAFRRKRWNPFGVYRPDDGESGCAAFLYIDKGESV